MQHKEYDTRCDESCFTTVNNSLDVLLVCTVARNFRTKCIKVPEAE